MLRFRQVLCILVIALPAACDKPPTAPSPAPTVVEVSVAAPTIHAGGTTRATAVVRDQHGNPMASQAVTWSSSDTSLATISSGGEITAVAAGEVTIRATAGQAVGSVELKVIRVPVASVSLSPDSASFYTGRTLQLTATPMNSTGTTLPGRAVTWSSSDTTVAVVNAGGVVTARRAGTVRITVSIEGKSAAASLVVKPAWVAVDSLPISYPGTLFGYGIGRRPDGSRLLVYSGPSWRGNSWTCDPIPHRALHITAAGRLSDATPVLNQTSTHAIHSAKGLVADVNGDGIDDFFFGNSGCDRSGEMNGEKNTLFLSQGGQFTDASSALPQINQFTHSVATGDLRSTGRPDILVVPMFGDRACPNSGSRAIVHILRNQGGGRFDCDGASLPDTIANPFHNFPEIAANYLSAEIADVNGDRRPDIILGARGRAGGSDAPSVGMHAGVVLINDGSGGFRGASSPLPQGLWGTTTINPSRPLVTDLNGDGTPDLVFESVTSGYSASRLQAFINDGRGNFADQTARIFPGQPTDQGWAEYVHRVDLDGDGCEDILRTRAGSVNDASTLAFRCTSSGSFVAMENREPLPDRRIGMIPVRFDSKTYLLSVDAELGRNHDRAIFRIYELR